jgi:hypothetical protein
MNSESTKQKLIRITSDDRDKQLYPNTNKFEVIFDKVDDLQKVYAIVVKHVSFTNTFYNMNNESLQLEYNGNPLNIFVTDFQWTIYQLLDFINNVGSWPTSHNWTYDEVRNKIFVTADASHTIKITGGTLVDKLGLEVQTTAQVVSFYGTYQINLAGVQHVFIYSKTLAQGKNMIKGRYLQEVPALIMIPNDVPFASVKHYETQHDNLDVVNFDDQINLQKIDIEVRDGAGDLLDTSNHNVSLVLKILYA